MTPADAEERRVRFDFDALTIAQHKGFVLSATSERLPHGAVVTSLVKKGFLVKRKYAPGYDIAPGCEAAWHHWFEAQQGKTKP